MESCTRWKVEKVAAPGDRGVMMKLEASDPKLVPSRHQDKWVW
jgi:hypothetical protein